MNQHIAGETILLLAICPSPYCHHQICSHLIHNSPLQDHEKPKRVEIFRLLGQSPLDQIRFHQIDSPFAWMGQEQVWNGPSSRILPSKR